MLESSFGRDGVRITCLRSVNHIFVATECRTGTGEEFEGRIAMYRERFLKELREKGCGTGGSPMGGDAGTVT